MRKVDIEIFNIARTSVDREAVRAWLNRLGAEGYEIPPQEAITDPALLVAMAAKRCYLSFEVGLNPNVTKIRKDLVEYIDNILKQGHGSVLEHATYTFAVEGVSRVFTAEMNRHRAGVAISEASMRYIRYQDIPYWLPTSITLTPEEKEVTDLCHPEAGAEDAEKLSVEQAQLLNTAVKKLRSQQVFRKAFAQDEENYQELQDIWASGLAEGSAFKDKKHITSMMRRIIPLGVATGAVYTLNIRALRHVLALRASAAAEEEILHVAKKMLALMAESEPALFGDFSEIPGGFFEPKYPKV